MVKDLKQEILKEAHEKLLSTDKPVSRDEVEAFLFKSLDRMESECLKMKGQLKREWYQQGWKEAVESLKKNHE